MSVPRSADRALIVTADDFGLDVRVNAAVERAHREGVLTSASLMVSAPAAADAVERARRLPTLRVGLHLVLADGASTLSSAEIPALVGTDGRFGDAMVRDGFRFFFCPRCARSLRAKSARSSPRLPQPGCRSITSTRTSTFICIRVCFR